MTDPEPASPPCAAPPGYWDPDDEPIPEDRQVAKDAQPKRKTLLDDKDPGLADSTKAAIEKKL